MVTVQTPTPQSDHGLPIVSEHDVDTLELSEASHSGRQGRDVDQANSPRRRNAQISKISLVVPVQNKGRSLEASITRLLSIPLRQDLEVVVVDDCSTDGNRETLERLVANHKQVKLIRHESPLGAGAALRTAIANLSGDVAIIFTGGTESQLTDLPAMVQPILDGKADAVFGSRSTEGAGHEHGCGHALMNRCLTKFCNALNGLHLTQFASPYRAVRTDILKELRLNSHTLSVESEIVTRLAQWGARILEVPISQSSSRLSSATDRMSYSAKIIAGLIWHRFLDNRFTEHTGMYVLRSTEKAQHYNTWLIDLARAHLGDRVIEAGAGIGNLSRLLIQREHVLLVDHDPMYVAHLNDSLGHRENVEVSECDLTKADFDEEWRKHKPDTIFCANVLEHLGPDQKILKAFQASLEDNGKCIIVVPAEPKLYNGLDRALGHHRRYTKDGLESLMRSVGFEIVQSEQFCKFGALAWFINGRILRREELTPNQMTTFDRLWPFISKFDTLLPWSGMSLIVVGKKVGDNSTLA